MARVCDLKRPYGPIGPKTPLDMIIPNLSGPSGTEDLPNPKRQKTNSSGYKINMKLQEFIGLLENLPEHLISVIKWPVDLVDALRELDRMIGMTAVKDSIVRQVVYLIHNKKTNFEETMLNTVLFGPPGVAKSKLGVILCKIWTAIGCIKKAPVGPKSLGPVGPIKPTPTDTEPPKSLLDFLKFISTGQLAGLDDGDDGHEGCQCKEIFENINCNATTLSRTLLEVKKTLRLIDLPESVNKDLHFLKVGLKEIIFDSAEAVDTSDSDSSFDGGDTAEDIPKKYHSTRSSTKSKSRRASECIDDLLGSEMLSEPINIVTRSTHVPIVQDPLSTTMSTSISITVPMMSAAIPYDDPDPPLPGLPCPEPTIPKRILARNPKTDDNFVIVSRTDFVANYLGQSSNKTLDLLEANLGKVLFIDEAYNLIHDDQDSYGLESLTTLNLFMSQHPSDIIIIFAGYKEQMQDTIFKYQPGLQRRCTWTFDIEPPDSKNLMDIFLYQISNEAWSMKNDVSDNDLQKFFTNNISSFKAGYGGDTAKLIHYAKLEKSFEDFHLSLENPDYIPIKTFTVGLLEKALVTLKANQTLKDHQESISRKMMYI